MIGPVTGAVLLTAKSPILQAPIVTACAMLSVGGLLSVWLWHIGRLRTGLGALGVASLAVYSITMGWIMPARDHRLPVAEFVQSIRHNAPPGTRIYTYSLGMDPSVYYLDAPVRRLESADELKAKLREDDEALVITYDSFAPQLGEIGESTELNRMRIEPNSPVSPKHPPLVLALVRKLTVNRPAPVTSH